jgi:Homeodomain-like domain
VATPKAVTIELSGAEAAELASRLRRRKVARADAMRAEIVLLAAEGVSNVAIAERLGTTRVTVATWHAASRALLPFNFSFWTIGAWSPSDLRRVTTCWRSLKSVTVARPPSSPANFLSKPGTAP